MRKTIMESKIEIYQSRDKQVELSVNFNEDTV